LVFIIALLAPGGSSEGWGHVYVLGIGMIFVAILHLIAPFILIVFAIYRRCSRIPIGAPISAGLIYYSLILMLMFSFSSAREFILGPLLDQLGIM